MRLFDLCEKLRIGATYTVKYQPAKLAEPVFLYDARVVVGRQQYHLVGRNLRRVAIGAGTRIERITEDVLTKNPATA